MIDASNRTDSGPANSHEAVAAVPGARYARAFNSIGVDTLRSPNIDGTTVDMLYACASADRAVVASLIRTAGPRPVWTGEDNWEVCDASLKLWLGLARTFVVLSFVSPVAVLIGQFAIAACYLLDQTGAEALRDPERPISTPTPGPAGDAAPAASPTGAQQANRLPAHDVLARPGAIGDPGGTAWVVRS